MSIRLRSGLGAAIDWRAWTALGLPALTVALGLQTLRALLPLTVYVLRDRFDWAPYQVGLLAFAVFASGFLFGALHRLLGTIRSLVVTAGGLGLLRLAAQAWQGDPLGDLFLAFGGVVLFVLFVLFLPSYLSYARSQRPGATGRYALALLLGLSLDTIVVGAFGTYDVFWREGAAAVAAAVVLVAAQLACLIASVPLRGGGQGRLSGNGISWGQVAPWVAVGPLLFLQIQVFQNVARLGALTSWEVPEAFAWIAFSNAAGVAAAAWTLRYWRRATWPMAVLLGVVLAVVLSFERREAAVAAVTLLAGQLSVAVLVVLILTPLGAGGGTRGPGPTAVIHGAGMIALTALLFGYYVAFELKVLYDKTILLPIAGVLLGAAALGSALSPPAGRPAAITHWRPAAVASMLVVVPVAMLFTWDTPASSPGGGYPLRVMTYNLHAGFNTDGALDMEAIARVIEEQQVDVIGLQEVSRGWAINGPTDMLSWLSHRLQMPYIYGPTAGPLWGNALLSRYPVVEYREVELSPRDLRLRRGFIWARLDLGEGQELRVITTHYHHTEEEGHIREVQSQEILDFLEGAGPAVVMGDLNAHPEEPEVVILLDSGLKDTLEEVVPGYTSKSDDPVKRIDYILVPQGFTASDPAIPLATASDHLPVVVTIAPP